MLVEYRAHGVACFFLQCQELDNETFIAIIGIPILAPTGIVLAYQNREAGSARRKGSMRRSARGFPFDSRCVLVEPALSLQQFVHDLVAQDTKRFVSSFPLDQVIARGKDAIVVDLWMGARAAGEGGDARRLLRGT